MAYVRRLRVNATVTATGGAAQTFYTDQIQGGFLESIVYQKATASGFSTAGNLTITAEQSGLSLLNVTATGAAGVPVAYYPRAAAQSPLAGTYSPATGAGAVVGFPEKIPLSDEAIKIVASSGGTASNGGVRFALDFYVSGG